jgi:uncharacterized membrane-anchored protein YitT (DUF2179 family)
MSSIKNVVVRKKITDLILLLLGTALFSFAVTVILKPNSLITGGITGLSILAGKVTGIPFTLYYYGLSALVLAATHFLLGKQESKKILLLSVLFPVTLTLFDQWLFTDAQFNLTGDDLFLSSVYFGVIAGIGAGLILLRGYSSGGTDSIGKILHKRFFPFVSISQLIAIIDMAVILLSALVFDIQTALYAVLMQIVQMWATELVLYGFTNKMVKMEIISEQSTEIENYILNTLGRGITKYNIIGGYSNEQRIKLVSICSQRESMLIAKQISSIDKDAFVTAMPVISVWGRGVGFETMQV